MVLSPLGIPRALYYFQYYPLWTSYLEELGFEIVVSPWTNGEILAKGLLTCVDGACLPVKAFVGHALALSEAGVGQIFIPELISVWKREYICTSFLGLPDLVRQYLPSQTVVLRPKLDGRKGKLALAKSYWQFGLLYAPFWKVHQAWKKALQAQEDFLKEANLRHDQKSQKITLLVIGPRYLIDDPFLNGNLLNSLANLSVQVVTSHKLDDYYAAEVNWALNKPFFWTGARKSIGALDYFQREVQGVINLQPFPCGAQALVNIVLEKQARKYALPLLNLSLDEHTSELGVLTRIEAFCDLLERSRSS